MVANILNKAFDAAALEDKDIMMKKKRNEAPAVAPTMAMGQDSIQSPTVGEKDAAADEGTSDFKATAAEFNLIPKASPNDAVNVAAAAPKTKTKSLDSLPTDPAAMVSLSPFCVTSPSPDQKGKLK